jgi:hypothetical protein
MAEASALLFDRLKNLRDILGFVAGLDPAKLQALLAALQAVRVAPDTKARVLAVAAALQVFATLSPTPADNLVSAALNKLLQSPLLLELTVRLLDKQLAGVKAEADFKAEATEAEMAEATALGMDWGQLLGLVKMIAEIIKLLK